MPITVSLSFLLDIKFVSIGNELWKNKIKKLLERLLTPKLLEQLLKVKLLEELLKIEIIETTTENRNYWNNN